MITAPIVTILYSANILLPTDLQRLHSLPALTPHRLDPRYDTHVYFTFLSSPVVVIYEHRLSLLDTSAPQCVRLIRAIRLGTTG